MTHRKCFIGVGRYQSLAGHPALRIAVNISVRQFNQAGFQELTAHIVMESGLPAAALNLEITEACCC